MIKVTFHYPDNNCRTTVTFPNSAALFSRKYNSLDKAIVISINDYYDNYQGPPLLARISNLLLYKTLYKTSIHDSPYHRGWKKEDAQQIWNWIRKNRYER